MTDVTAEAGTKVSATTNSGWLCLKRAVGQDVVINHEITVRVLEICGSQARLGFKAPLAMPVHRREIEDNARHGGGEG